jgi:hypothetical protein
MRWGIFRIVMRLKVLLKKYYTSGDIEVRNQMRIRDCLTLGAGMILSIQAEQNAKFKAILPFLKETGWKYTLECCIDNFGSTIGFI